MSNIILAGASAVGGTLLRTAGNVALGVVSQSINRAFDNRVFEGPRLETLHIQSSRDGAPIPRLYGKVRIAGQVIWAAKLKETVTEERQGGKGGGPRSRTYSYTISFAIGLCEGEILGVEKIWANGEALPLADLNMRVHKGTFTQNPDPLIAEIEGPNVPAYRGTAYVVFEDMPLDDFGARLPQLNFEVVRVPETASEQTRMENLITGINLIPGSGEFAYSPDIIEEISAPGSSTPINMNNLFGSSDFDAAVDQLDIHLPNCTSVTLLVSWFGNDLRLGDIQLRPGVENNQRLTHPQDWRVNGEDRSSAYVVSTFQGRPVYGGTPSDASIIAAIKALKARGFSVSLYPFILMDVPPDNQLPNPYSGTSQAAFPWRGRITCMPAIGQPNSADQSSAARDQIQSFFGQAATNDFSILEDQISYTGSEEHSLRRMILHYAHVCQAAGGVESFIISSEMRGMTTLRDDMDDYPAVDLLRTLAADVRSIVGAQTKLTYAADWSEYFGHHPQDGTGDVRFHLDPLWADDNIDAVGIDAYFPLADWRDTPDHADAQFFDNTYEGAYLTSNMEGGEGYDWYYASAQDRTNQTRTPITDGLANKPWVFRYKDVKAWWANPHYERTGGVELSEKTAWDVQSKPIWFTEIGCPAIDKGANQPNVFWDPKSSESLAPYFSNTERDDFIQRRYIESFLSYWQSGAGNNPVSTQYGGPMVDLNHTRIWCWDARPYPDFPARDDVWADGDNWRRGHWINGRTGLVLLADVVNDLHKNATDTPANVNQLFGVVSGYLIDRPMSARAAISPLMQVYGFDIVERASDIRYITKGIQAPFVLPLTTLQPMQGHMTPLFQRKDPEERLKDVRMNFIDQEHDYQSGAIYARDLLSETVHILDIRAPLVLDQTQAKLMSEAILQRSLTETETATCGAGAFAQNLEVGDVISFENIPSLWQITELDGQAHKTLKLRRTSTDISFTLNGNEPGIETSPVWTSRPDGYVLDIADFTGQGERAGVLVGAVVRPWVNGVVEEPGGVTATLTQPVSVGNLITELHGGPVGRFDQQESVDIYLPGATLSSLNRIDVLGGGNMLAVDNGHEWEIFQCQQAELIATDTYRISGFLRGLYGTDEFVHTDIPVGSRIVSLSSGWQELKLAHGVRGNDMDFSFTVKDRPDSETVSLLYKGQHVRPLSPVHAKAHITGDNLAVTWIRRTRIGGDDWVSLDVPLGEAAEVYEVDFSVEGDVFYTQQVFEPRLDIVLALLEAENGGALNYITLTIYQISQSYGRGVGSLLDIDMGG